MGVVNYLSVPGLAACLLLTGCAVSPEAEEAQRQREADIREILSYELDPAEYGETKRCLAEREYRTFKALDDKHILFFGRGDKQWINSLRADCPDLRQGEVLAIESFSAMRICDGDTFTVAEWFNWNRRLPWQSGRGSLSGIPCNFGEFQPVTAEQVAEIEAVLESR